MVKRTALAEIYPQGRTKRPAFEVNPASGNSSNINHSCVDENGQIKLVTDCTTVDINKPKNCLKYSFSSCPYADEIYQTQLDIESKFVVKSGQGVNWDRLGFSFVERASVVDWLFEVTQDFHLKRETLFLAVNILDRFLLVSEPDVSPDFFQVVHFSVANFLQLLALSSLFVASKYEEIDCPGHNQLFQSIAGSPFESSEVIRLEAVILNALDYDLTVSTILTFLSRYLEVGQIKDKTLISYAHNLAVCCLSSYTLQVFYPTSLLAASIVCLTKYKFGEQSIYSPEFLSYTKRSQQELHDCLHQIIFHLKEVNTSMKEKKIESSLKPKNSLKNGRH